MQPKRPRSSRSEQSFSLFQVQPDWYEEYWLRPTKASSMEAKWRRPNLFLGSKLYAAIVSMLVYFGH